MIHLKPIFHIEHVNPPPRFLLGSSLMFWGMMTDRPLIGLMAALLVEARHWTKLRWDFDEGAYESGWQMSVVLTLIAGVVVWLNESRYTAILVVMAWLPVLFLPMQFVQTYGLKDSVDVGSLSFLAKSSRLRNKRLGLKVQGLHFNFGNVLFVVTILAAAVGIEESNRAFLPILVVLCGWALLATGRCRWKSLVPVLLVSGLLALLGQYGLEHLENWLSRGSGSKNDHFDPNYHPTRIGSSGRVELPSEILWRLNTLIPRKVPMLLRTATYSHYMGGSWRNPRLDFKQVEGDPHKVNGQTCHKLTDRYDVDSLVKLPAYRLRGTVEEKILMPLSGTAAGIRGLNQVWVERNSLGTVRIFPDAPVIDATVFWDGDTNPEISDEVEKTLLMLSSERDMIRRVVDEMGLKKIEGFQGKLNYLKDWFQQNIRYTLDLTIKQPPNNNSPSAIEQFLTTVRAGHCEYFATAATLMLREAGVPSKYAIGYAVLEKDFKTGEYRIRGIHGHAWCRVWDDENHLWVDFDPTPSDWMSVASADSGVMQAIKDFIKQAREDFFLWRTDPDHESLIILILSGVGLSLSGFVIRRLWRSRRRLPVNQDVGYRARQLVRTPLHGLESLASKHLGLRPVGLPYGQWLEGLNRLVEEKELLGRAIAMHQCLRFDPVEHSEDEHRSLAGMVERIEEELKKMKVTETSSV